MIFGNFDIQKTPHPNQQGCIRTFRFCSLQQQQQRQHSVIPRVKMFKIYLSLNKITSLWGQIGISIYDPDQLLGLCMKLIFKPSQLHPNMLSTYDKKTSFSLSTDISGNLTWDWRDFTCLSLGRGELINKAKINTVVIQSCFYCCRRIVDFTRVDCGPHKMAIRRNWFKPLLILYHLSDFWSK